jgi:hypothetical protein
MRERIDPEYRGCNCPNDHESGNPFEWYHVVGTAHAVLDGTKELYDIRDVFVLGTKVECNPGAILLGVK